MRIPQAISRAISHRRNQVNGALVLTVEVTDGSMIWFESRSFYGYELREAKLILLRQLDADRLKVVVY